MCTCARLVMCIVFEVSLELSYCFRFCSFLVYAVPCYSILLCSFLCCSIFFSSLLSSPLFFYSTLFFSNLYAYTQVSLVLGRLLGDVRCVRFTVKSGTRYDWRLKSLYTAGPQTSTLTFWCFLMLWIVGS